MEIRTIGAEWGVFALWLGSERCVFRGDLFACIAYAGES